MNETSEYPIGAGTLHTDEDELLIGDCVVRYGCCGAGRPVLALAAEGRMGMDVVAALSWIGRVIVPMPPATLSTWLPDFLDGLGLDRPPVVADGALAEPVLGLLLRDPFRLGPVALLLREDRDMPAGLPAAGLLDAISHPLLLMPLPGDGVTPAELQPLLDFVRDGGRGR